MRINLLPPKIKKDLRYEAASQRVTLAGFLSVTVIAWFALLLVGAVLFAEMKSAELSRQIQKLEGRAETRDIESFSQQLRLARGNIERLNLVQKDGRLRFTSLVRKLIAVIPPDIVLKDLQIDRGQQKITFAGQALNRETLLLLKSRIESAADYANVSLPLEQLLKKTNLPFSLSFTLK